MGEIVNDAASTASFSLSIPSIGVDSTSYALLSRMLPLSAISSGVLYSGKENLSSLNETLSSFFFKFRIC